MEEIKMKVEAGFGLIVRVVFGWFLDVFVWFLYGFWVSFWAEELTVTLLLLVLHVFWVGLNSGWKSGDFSMSLAEVGQK